MQMRIPRIYVVVWCNCQVGLCYSMTEKEMKCRTFFFALNNNFTGLINIALSQFQI